MQMMRSGKFQKYDNGPYFNIKKYGFKNAPEYPIDNLINFDTPKYLIRGEIDYLADQKDYLSLLQLLPQESTLSEVIIL